MNSSTRKYGLQLRGAPAAAKKPLLPQKPSIFDDQDEDDVEQAIARQASKNRALNEVEQQHKSALAQDPTVFDYDGVYDEMKGKSARVVNDDPNRNKPKYITKLIEKANFRKQEQDIVYERKLAKERALEDHMYGDKEKFITGAYKKKLAEQAKWLEEERLRDLREQAEEVTKKGDLGDFYRNLLSKNIAFGATSAMAKDQSQEIQESPHSQQDRPSETVDAGRQSENVEVVSESEQDTKVHALIEEAEAPLSNTETEDVDGRHGLRSEYVSAPESSLLDPSKESDDSNQKDILSDKSTAIRNSDAEPSKPNVLPSEHRPTTNDLAAAKARYLARKRTRDS